MSEQTEIEPLPRIDAERRNITEGGPKPGYRFKFTGASNSINYRGGAYLRTEKTDHQGRAIWQWEGGGQ